MSRYVVHQCSVYLLSFSFFFHWQLPWQRWRHSDRKEIRSSPSPQLKIGQSLLE